MNNNAGLYSRVWKCLCVNLCWIVLLAGVFRPQHAVSDSTKDLLSPYFQPIVNTPETVELQWNFDVPPTETEQTILLFVPGPVDSATCFVRSYQWVQKEDGQTRANGDESNIPDEYKLRVPTVKWREIGLMSGCRVAVLTLRIQRQTYARESGETVVDFPLGSITMIFSEQDEDTFQGFSQALDESARTVFVNYPPTRQMDSAAVPQQDFPYITHPSIKRTARQPGMYRLSGKEVLDGINQSFIPVDAIALFQNQKPIQRVIVDENASQKTSGNLEPADAIYYYSPQSQSSFSPNVVTWITVHRDSVKTAAALRNAQTGTETLHRHIHLEQDEFHLADRKRNEEQNQYWMWHNFSDGEIHIPFPVVEEIKDATAFADIHLDLRNSNYAIQPKNITASINARVITSATVIHTGNNKFTLQSQVLSSALAKNNTFTLDIQDAFQLSNTVHLDSVDLYYPTEIKNSSNAYTNPLGYQNVTIPNDAGLVIAVQHHKDDTHSLLVRDKTPSNAIELPEGETVLYCLSPAAQIASATIEKSMSAANRTVLSKHTPQADVLIVSPREWQPLFSAYQDLLTQQQSLTSKVIAVEDIYDVFGNGRLSPQAIKDFIRHAYLHWQEPKPSYVLLAGDATWDYWGRFNNGIGNIVPSYQGDENYAIENWFVRCDDPSDMVPDMVIARIPVRSSSELLNVLQKTEDYRTNRPLDEWLNRVLVITDNEFEQYTAELLDDWIPQGFQVTERHIADYPLVDNIYLPARQRAALRAKTSLEATEDIINRLNQGVFLWEFFGHGAPNVMGHERMFFGGGSKFSDVKKLSGNQKPHILWSFSCETTRFDYPHEKWNISIGEDLLTLPNGGSIAIVGAAGRGYPQDHIVLGRGLHEAAFEYGLSTFGLQYYTAQLMSLAFKETFEPIDQFAIFGDPALPMPRFIHLEGELLEDDSRYKYRFEGNDLFKNPLDGGAWIQNEDGSEFEILEKENMQGHRAFAAGLSKEYAKQFENGKAGEYFITTDNGKIVVGHGAVPIPSQKSATEYVAPTTGRLPDLTFRDGSMKIAPQSPRSGETIFVEAELINQGKGSAENFTVQGFRNSGDGNETAFEVVVGERSIRVDQLNPGERRTVKLRWDGTANAGEHTLIIKADSNLQINESNDDNNSIASLVSVRKKADLVLNEENVSVNRSGNQYHVSYKVINRGESKAERVVLEISVVRNGNEQILRFPLNRSTRQVEPMTIDVGGEYAHTFNLPADIESFTITVDPDEIVDEETHENNQYTFTPSQI